MSLTLKRKRIPQNAGISLDNIDVFKRKIAKPISKTKISTRLTISNWEWFSYKNKMHSVCKNKPHGIWNTCCLPHHNQPHMQNCPLWLNEIADVNMACWWKHFFRSKHILHLVRMFCNLDKINCGISLQCSFIRYSLANNHLYDL